MITNGDENDTSLLFFPESKVYIFYPWNEINPDNFRKIPKVIQTSQKNTQKELIMKTPGFPQV